MSLEEKIAENTQALREFTIAVTNLTEYLIDQKAQPEVAQNTGSRKRKTTKVASSPSDDSHASETAPESTVLTTAPVETAVTVEPVAENVTTEQPDPLANLPEETAPPTYKEVSDAIVGLANAKGRGAAIAILEQFGIAKLPEAKADQYAAIISACEEAL